MSEEQPAKRRRPLERRESATARMGGPAAKRYGARLNKRHADMVRAHIKASQLINRLQNFALANLFQKGASTKNMMTDAQVRATTALLNKVLPDIQRTELTGADGDPVEFSREKADGVAAAPTAADAAGDYYELMAAAAAPSTRH